MKPGNRSSPQFSTPPLHHLALEDLLELLLGGELALVVDLVELDPVVGDGGGEHLVG